MKRERKAFLFNSVMVIMGVVGFVATLVPALNLVLNLDSDAKVKTALIYNGGVEAEKILSAPCATERPGVFYDDALRSGDFNCIAPDKMYVKVRYPDAYPDIGIDSSTQTYYYEIYHDNSTSSTTVTSIPEGLFNYMRDGSWTQWTEESAVNEEQWQELDGSSKIIVSVPALSKDSTTGQVTPIWIDMVVV